MRTIKIASVVEGYGEETALPELLRNLMNEKDLYTKLAEQDLFAEFPKPMNAKNRDNLIKHGGLERFLEIARRQRQEIDGILILLDTDRDYCPKELASNLAERARALKLPFPVAIVCAHCEYEAWFLASLETIAGKTPIPEGVVYQGSVEGKRDAKGWLSAQMPQDNPYQETRDQATMSAQLDPALVRERSRSFRRLESALAHLLNAEAQSVTPLARK